MPTHEQEYHTHGHGWAWAPNVGLYKEAPNVTLFCRKVGLDADVI